MALLAGCSSFLPWDNATEESAEESGDENDAASDGSAEDVELIEPAGSEPGIAAAAFRNIYSTQVYQGVVSPDIVTYSYESEQDFGGFLLLPGDEIKAGDSLFMGNTFALDDSIDEIAETNSKLLRDHNDQVSDAAIDITKAKLNEFEAASAYQDACANAPDEKSDAYAGWSKGVMPLESRYKSAKAARENAEEALKKSSELFDLEYAYNEKRISRLEEEKAKSGRTSTEDGVVAGIIGYLPGDYIAPGTDIMAVGNPDDKEIISEYIPQGLINKCEEVYALIDGVRYEVVYEPMDATEYKRLKTRDNDVYTTFKLTGADNVPLGRYAVIVVVESRESNALCVPKDAVIKDESGTYVYLYKDSDSVYTPVKTGVSDSAYTQILSGISEGDEVVYDNDLKKGEKTAQITKGESHTDFSIDGRLYYPGTQWVMNPAKYGTGYLQEILVNKYEQVTEGQVLARIEIVADTIEIDRLKRKIERQNERIADLNKVRNKTYDKDSLESLDRSIRDRQRTIEELNRSLSKISQYVGVVELKAPYDGLITDLCEIKEGEIIYYRQKLVQIASDDSCFIEIEDRGGVLAYGNECEVTFKDGAVTKTSTGTVVTAGMTCLPGIMRTGQTLIRLSREDMDSLISHGSDNEGGYWSRIRFNIKSSTKSMNDVLLIPKSAVTRIGNDTFVSVSDDSGRLSLIRFVAGGTDTSNYWVAYGDVSEGMTVCYD